MSDLGPEARSILRAGRDGDEPRASDRARMRRKISQAIAAGGGVGAAGAAGAAAEGAAAAAGKGITAALLGKVFGGLLIAGALGTGVYVASAQRGPNAPVAPSAAAMSSVAVAESGAAKAVSAPS